MKTPRAKHNTQHTTSASSRPVGSVRIVGGRWRGSKLPVPERESLRPTADRVRETVFNWLQPVMPGARVLDLFAGSGALGLEALSRGARTATLIERDHELAISLRTTLERLRRGDTPDVDCTAEVLHTDASVWLAAAPAEPTQAYDVIFLDPPFASDLWRTVLDALPPWLADDAWLYLESPRESAPRIEPDSHWCLHREGATRDVRYALYRRQTTPMIGLR